MSRFSIRVDQSLIRGAYLCPNICRHDIDRSLPRTPKEIFNSNQIMVDKMRDTFSNDVLIVPSVGNNDIYPHNVLAPGPNSITSEFLQYACLHQLEPGADVPVGSGDTLSLPTLAMFSSEEPTSRLRSYPIESLSSHSTPCSGMMRIPVSPVHFENIVS